ncbi:MAG: deoxyribodipyrimidine photo-lyase [Anaerolineaceae bacterium]|nr:deoxyribodipyrimidine photo-lyase [Anaerolineaceae bacterium]
MNIWWIRRDLRLNDNAALSAALGERQSVLPVFILDDHLLGRPAEKRQSFLFAGLRALENDLVRLGSGLIIRRGHPAVELKRLAAESHASRVFAEADVSPYASQRDASVARQVDLHLVHGAGFYPPGAVKNADGRPYRVFTPYSRAWKALPFSDQMLPAPGSLNPIPELPSEQIPGSPAWVGSEPGEAEARRRLNVFLDGPIFSYRETRDRMDLDGTSRLSAHIRFGLISIRQVVISAVRSAGSAPDARSRAGCDTWLNELIWREFYRSILSQYPAVLQSSFKPGMSRFPWRDAPHDLQAWQTGQTGYPVVDAAMRQLAATGWMHNRARMIAASFLVKHLLINWQAGEHWFMQALMDGDPASNNGGWQWVAGSGTDAAPYFRIFNPTLQGKKYDPIGGYVRRWVPELTGVPDRYIHNPWEMTTSEQHACGVIIGRDYPSPLVEHAFARTRALATYKAHKDQPVQ